MLEDFNHCRLDQVLPFYHQCVKTPLTGNAVLDLYYGNATSTYQGRACPALGKSDHNIIQLLPHYRQALKWLKSTIKVTRNWSSDSMEKLCGCFECTDWSVLVDLVDSMDIIVSAMTDYIKFCIDLAVPVSRKQIVP